MQLRKNPQCLDDEEEFVYIVQDEVLELSLMVVETWLHTTLALVLQELVHEC
jgi:hypothetical protein